MIPAATKNAARAVARSTNKSTARTAASTAARAAVGRGQGSMPAAPARGITTGRVAALGARRASASAAHGGARRAASTFSQEYAAHVAERTKEGVVPLPLNAGQVAELVELLKAPPAGEEAMLLELLVDRVPPGVDEAAYVKAGFLAAVAQGEASSPLISRAYATELLGTMQGGYNVAPLVGLLDDKECGPIAAKCLSSTLLVFDAFYDVEAKV